MIKEKKIKNRVNKKKEFIKEIIGYTRTAFISFLIGAVFTILLSFHARSEMIKNLYENKSAAHNLERQVALEIVSHTDLTASLNDKNYAICMQVGRIYEAAGELEKADYAYHLAQLKSPIGVYTAFYKQAVVLIELGKINQAEELIESVPDVNSVNLIKFKTRAYMVLGDKYFSESKFLKSADSYEKSEYYYSRLKKQDKYVQKSIIKRLVNAYVEAAAVIVKNGYNSDAVRFLKQALKYEPDNYLIKYRLAIIYADLDPIESIKYFEPLLQSHPQEIDYRVYNRALMKAANIEELKGDLTKAKYYRYKNHSLDLFLNNKVVYKDDVEIFIENFEVKKRFFRYRIKMQFIIKNTSPSDIVKLNAEYVLKQQDKQKESIIVNIADRKNMLFSNGGESDSFTINFGKNIYTKKELANYSIDVYLYKDPKYKTLIGTYKIPIK